ncbi:MAG TPA: helix-turn-helix transcriptional regulator [Bacillota bacterium]|jgi:transcriptional regulator with XRE-family HTH domain|nr:helix-turn-helix transcriptional regulator [Bacillota bacterium]HOB87833.1 helix-turn-helix transcriptional regulator [Bacillota bacterium]HOP69938.1 helix-turn-helix transcriptional regulator [Bacillota bacterium]HPT34810.1 helix-turn-helix transcriptional regulator [Bacillota bacterium]HPZ64511.1 helix-turn-helix transcriptional regulator [Bacillota bacterium]
MSVELGRRIKALRRLKRVTQQELASRIKVSVTTLSSIERGQKVPPPQLLENIALNLNVSGEELFILPKESEPEKVD